MIRHCPRCELRFATEAEVKEHLVVDHGATAETLERLRYPGTRLAEPLYGPEADPVVRRYLVVANQTLGGSALVAHLRERAAGPASVFVLVPATHSADVSQPPSTDDVVVRDTDATGAARAHRRLRQTLDELRAIGLEVEGEVGPADPYLAIQQIVERQRFDEIILSTLPPGLSRWLGMDLPRRVERSSGLPVTTLVATA